MTMKEELAPAMIEKAREAITRSNFWEFIERTCVLELAVASAVYDGDRGPKRLRKAAKAMVPKISDPLMRRFMVELSTASQVMRKLDELKQYRDSLIRKVAYEFTEAEKFGDVGEYRRQRAARMIQEAA